MRHNIYSAMAAELREIKLAELSSGVVNFMRNTSKYAPVRKVTERASKPLAMATQSLKTGPSKDAIALAKKQVGMAHPAVGGGRGASVDWGAFA